MPDGIVIDAVEIFNIGSGRMEFAKLHWFDAYIYASIVYFYLLFKLLVIWYVRFLWVLFNSLFMRENFYKPYMLFIDMFPTFSHATYHRKWNAF